MLLFKYWQDTITFLIIGQKSTWFISLPWKLGNLYYNSGECVELLIRNLKECLKSGSKWEEARYLVRFIADLVNCHVISAGSLLQLLDNFVDAALEDGVPQVMFSKLFQHKTKSQEFKIYWPSWYIHFFQRKTVKIMYEHL